MTGHGRKSVFRGLLESEAAGGVLLIVVAALALLVANSPLADAYFGALHTPLGGLDLLHWINDGLMAVFFLLVGLEIKREMAEGALSTWSGRALPAVGALGGMAVPALIYVAVQGGSAETLHGWAIPAATDIAFALGVLAILGRNAPVSLKVFLAALAIIDDLGAVLIIALFYTSGLSLPALGGAAAVAAGLALMNWMKVTALWPYLLGGVALWTLMLFSGVHPTLAGVILAMTIPLKAGDDRGSPLHRLEHALHKPTAFVITPLFGFANAGVALSGLGLAALSAPVTVGVAAGLFAGKLIGVFGASWLAIRLGLARLPAHAGYGQLLGVAALCGIGFTMSLFIGALAFADPMLQDEAKVGVLAGSVMSALTGWVLLRLSRPPQAERPGGGAA